ncbi:unnamed protein product [Mesocestoides corti]|uniref:Uncharacterized protein n=1 Tax=Mesocestoides corti TaxID=53468 RepID=A0A0R3U6S6_MESCO|nr:unnamed protein product [Mesocestoides corti]
MFQLLASTNDLSFAEIEVTFVPRKPEGRSINSSCDSSGQSPLGSGSATLQQRGPTATTQSTTPSSPVHRPAPLPPTNNNVAANPAVPSLATPIREMDPNMPAELMQLRATIQEKDRRLDELHLEVEKLSSVLQQHISECDTWKKNPPAIAEHLFRASSIRQGVSGALENDKQQNNASDSSTAASGDTLSPLRPLAAPAVPSKRLGVSAEPTMAMQSVAPVEMKYYDKDAKSRQEIRNALRNNEFLKNLDAVQLQEIVSCMYEHSIVEGCYIIREGEDGHHLYVAAEGEYEVWKNGKYLYTMGPGNCFGELALLYNCKRTASIKGELLVLSLGFLYCTACRCVSYLLTHYLQTLVDSMDCQSVRCRQSPSHPPDSLRHSCYSPTSISAVRAARIWVLERSIFQFIMMKTGLEKMEGRVKFLSRRVNSLFCSFQCQKTAVFDLLQTERKSTRVCLTVAIGKQRGFWLVSERWHPLKPALCDPSMGLYVPLLKNLDDGQLERIADVLEAQFHPAGECIIRQGEQADSFFIIQSGEVRVTMKVVGQDGLQNEIEIRRMTKGEYFGEKALLGEGRRTANIYAISPGGVELLCLYRKDFLELMGNIADLQHKEYVDLEHLQSYGGQLKDGQPLKLNEDDPTVALTSATGSTSLDHLLGQREVKQAADVAKTTTVPSRKLYAREYEVAAKLRLNDLQRVAVIGQGGFGRVELVRPVNDSTISFALKRMKKVHIVQTKQQDHVHSEKQILMSVDSCFICKLFKTFRDNKFVYMLMEFCPGGELWTVLRDRRAFDDKLTRFSLACVIEAFDYLHHQGIIYRDLKPENMLLTSNGYIKLVSFVAPVVLGALLSSLPDRFLSAPSIECDFGFAKRLDAQRKTWTFCGTPEYVAPEVILNKGHDFAADYWSLGILTCELLIGTPPFQASEPIKIYMKALRGIEAYDLSHHKNISIKAYQFIKRLCRNTPTERLGMGRQGIQEIRNQKYFQGFDWDGVRNRTLQSPFQPKVSGPCDFSNFDQFPVTDDLPPDEMSGWDKDF